MRFFGEQNGWVEAGQEYDQKGGWRTIWRFEGSVQDVKMMMAQANLAGATTRSSYTTMPAFVEAWLPGPMDGTEPTQDSPFTNGYTLQSISEYPELWELPKIRAITDAMEVFAVTRLHQDVNAVVNQTQMSDEAVTAILETFTAYPVIAEMVKKMAAGITTFRRERWVLENTRTFPLGFKWNFNPDYENCNKQISSANLQATQAALGLKFTIPTNRHWLFVGVTVNQMRDTEQAVYRWEEEILDTWRYDPAT